MQDAGVTARDLEAENESLRASMAYMMEQAERNHDIMCRHQAFDLEIVGSDSFPSLVSTIFRSLPVISDLDIVTLSLVDEGEDIRTVMNKLGVDFADFPHLVFVDAVQALGFVPSRNDLTGPPRPLLGPYIPATHQPMFPQPPAGLQSIALVPLLRNKRLIGSLNLGSLDPNRFTPAMATDFVEHMASIISICLENVISNEMLKYIGLTDSLTGVYNRRYIDRRLLEEISRARRQQYRISVMYIDIDHFKLVNDSVGHPGGDEVLREVAGRIKDELRLSDTMGRFGGEEFVALLINAELDAAALVAERIRASVAGTPVELQGGAALPVSVSIGVAVLNDFEREHAIEHVAQELLAQADNALYKAKQSGRNRVIAYEAPPA
ncbi:diguanylate cyclase [Massilia sp. CF038]|uniref:GGDEF domain-containing protein n=1 Tax=Massilia sp. CF038 TaxID=1881045 RepID=UPI0009131F89|nr:sensor domain-containing diguanylate cyclase [Massilia sp. CF038]SHH61586.1 diguanylate cyclase (GGDEF) domain-containing protein [Massilia sp. CF038]